MSKRERERERKKKFSFEIQQLSLSLDSKITLSLINNIVNTYQKENYLIFSWFLKEAKCEYKINR